MIRSDETEIRGTWRVVGDHTEADSVCQRVDELMRRQLRVVGPDASGWDVLYVDPSDGRFWELTYPNADMHGGGPPLLKVLSDDEARDKYRSALSAWRG